MFYVEFVDTFLFLVAGNLPCGNEFPHVVYTVPQGGKGKEGAVGSRQHLVLGRGKALHPAHGAGLCFMDTDIFFCCIVHVYTTCPKG